jgi:putative endonuclease
MVTKAGRPRAAKKAAKKKAKKAVRAARPEPWWTYLVRCGDGSLYAGATNDLERRVRRHAEGKGARYTRSRPPIVLAWSEKQRDRSAALKREAALKRLRRSAKEALIFEGAPASCGPTPTDTDRRAGTARILRANTERR